MTSTARNRPGLGATRARGALLLVLCACGQAPPPPAASSSLNGAAARVGGVTIQPSLVADVAQARGVSARVALDGLVADALAAQGAQLRGLDRDPAVSWPRVAAIARRVPSHLAEEASALGPPTDDELALVSVVHAVVLRAPNLREGDALAIASGIRRAVVEARNADDFEVRAKAVNHPHAQVRVERIGPFAADGRSPDGQEFESGFVAAAFALRAPLDTSPIVATSFGWHVLQLVARAPADGALANRRIELASAVVQMRGRIRLDAILRARQQSTPLEISVAADDLMSAAIAQP